MQATAMKLDELEAPPPHAGFADNDGGGLNLDRDSLHILPLLGMPLMTPALQRARLVKNSHLCSVLELFQDAATGSGQIEVPKAAREFAWKDGGNQRDFVILQKLADLPSYDVYSLRIALRHLGIDVNEQASLRLSERKRNELNAYMKVFTRPLLHKIYGETLENLNDITDILALFRNPNREKAVENLHKMADTLQISLDEVPQFLEDYGDIFLSLSYYRQYLDHLEPMISDFVGSLDELRDNYQLKADRNFLRTCDMIEQTLNDRMTSVTGRLENFYQSTNSLWENLSAERFNKVRAVIQGYHISIGGILCALSVKMNAWMTMFPDGSVGGPVRRAEMIMSDMKQGIDKIIRIEDSTPLLASLQS